MAIVDDIRLARTCGVVMYGELDVLGTDPRVVPHSPGLTIPADLSPLSAQDATRLLAGLIHRDLAYQTECVAPARALELARRYVERRPETTAYLTNASQLVTLAGSDLLHPSAWVSATTAAFDCGILCLVPEAAACWIWFADED